MRAVGVRLTHANVPPGAERARTHSRESITKLGLARSLRRGKPGRGSKNKPLVSGLKRGSLPKMKYELSFLVCVQ